MRFYTQSHQHYCGIDLHTQVMYLCILNHEGEVILHRNMKSEPQAFLSAIAPYREDLVVGAECIFCWYWLADLCEREGIRFVLGHDSRTWYRLMSVPGIGEVLALVILYEIQDIARFMA